MEEIKALANIGSIEFDHEELKSKVNEVMEIYKDFKVTSGTVGDAKNKRAELNKLKDAIDAKRKEIKKIYLVPLDDFESKVKEITTIIDEVSKRIDSQVKELEELDKENKRTEIMIYFGEKNCPVSAERLFNQKWLNMTVTEKQWKSGVDEVVDKVNSDIELLKSFSADQLLINLYLDTLDVLTAKQRYTVLTETNNLIKNEVKEVKTEPNNDKLISYEFEILGTQDEVNLVKEFMDKNGITYMEGLL